MSKNSFRIDDILSAGSAAAAAAGSRHVQQQAVDQCNNTELQRTLYYLLNQQLELQQAQRIQQEQQQTLLASLKQNQFGHNNISPGMYLNDYYSQLLNLPRHSMSTKDTSEDFYGSSSKRFKSSSPELNPGLKHFVPSQDQVTLLLNKYLHLSNSHHRVTKNPSSISSSASSLSNSSNHNEVLNSSPRSFLSNSDDTTGLSGVNSCENVSPLDALLHLANTTFTNKMAQQIKQEEAVLMSSFKKSPNMYTSDENGQLANDLLLETSRTSHNTSFDSSLNGGGSISKFNKPNVYFNKKQLSPDSNTATVSLSTSVSSSAKRKRKNRTAFTANQIFELEKRFSLQRYLSPHDRDRIAYELSLSTAQVITWFQNRRAKQKRDIEEMKNDLSAAQGLKIVENYPTEACNNFYENSENESISEDEREEDNANVSSSSSSQAN